MVQKKERCGTDPSGNRVVVEEQHGQFCANKPHNLDYMGKCLKNMYEMLIQEKNDLGQESSHARLQSLTRKQTALG